MFHKAPKLGIFLVLVLLCLSPARRGLVSASDASPLAGGANVGEMQVLQVPGGPAVLDPEGVLRLREGGARVTLAAQTGGASFIVFSPAQSQALAQAAPSPREITRQADAFWQAYGAVFGVQDAGKELALSGQATERSGASHLTFNQVYQGLPVFGGQMKLHFDAHGQMTAVNGLFVPGIRLTTQPALDAAQAGALAVAAMDKKGSKALKTTLLIYRTGLAQGVAGENHLAYAVEVGNGSDLRDFVYLDALSGTVLDKINGIETINRSVYFNQYDPLQHTANLVWSDTQGQPYTGGDPDITSLIEIAGETYNLYANLSGGTYKSFDGLDKEMISVAHATDYLLCPFNAAWTGTTIEVCDGMAVDDVIAHEWSHAYTENTDNLVYLYQPGALNEAFSDIFGEIVDRLNGIGTDTPDTQRTAGVCAVDTAKDMELDVNQPASLAQRYTYVGTGLFGPLATTPLTSSLVRASDGVDVGDDACEAVTNAIAGKVALVQRSARCSLAQQIINAQYAGAAGVVLYNAATFGERVGNFYSNYYAQVNIPSVLVGNSLGVRLITALNSGPVSVTLRLYPGPKGSAPEKSLRWVLGEDATALGGAIRDMWEPTCFGDPGKVSDPQYACSTGSQDNGGVHTNSSIINHTFSLLTDGGVYNGQTVNGIGLTKAAAIYWEAEKNYQTALTDFANHAEALETACQALVNQPLYALNVTSTPAQVSDQRISAADCAQVHAATLATELRKTPVQCGFKPVLAQNPPALCGAAGQGSLVSLFSDGFEGATTGWTTGSQPGPATTDPNTPNWVVTDSLPGVHPGKAFYGIDSKAYGDCGFDNVSGVRMLYSPPITLPDKRIPYLAFDHYLATEDGYDGGNLWIQVNGGAWQPVLPGDITFNAYNRALVDSSLGNDNPLAGQPAFSGTDGGKAVGSWGQTQVNLFRYAHAGDTIRLGFYLSQDGCNGVDGWYVDNVTVYNCANDYARLNYLPVMRR